MASNLQAAYSALRGLIVRGTAFAMALVLASASMPVDAQNPAGISGQWVGVDTQATQERGYGLLPGDWAGVPLSTAGRAREYLYSSSLISVPSRFCRPHLSPWELAAGIAGLNFWPVIGADSRIVAWAQGSAFVNPPMMIWMNGMPQPSEYADHPANGFTVGHWQGDMLIAYTTHLKVAAIRRENAYASDQATITSTFIPHGSLMTAVYILRDPAYLTQPYIFSMLYVRSSSEPQAIGLRTPTCLPIDVGIPADAVPFYLPGKSLVVGTMMKFYHIPDSASEGGADTMYPAFRDRIRDQYLKTYHTFPSAKNCKYFCSTPADSLGASTTR